MSSLVIGDRARTTPGLRTLAAGTASPVADLLAHEKGRPDGQPQQTGQHADALCDPYDVLVLSTRTPVADAAANDVLPVAEDGTVRTRPVLPVSRKGRARPRPTAGSRTPAATRCRRARRSCRPPGTAAGAGPEADARPRSPSG